MNERVRLIGATEAEVSALNEVLYDLYIEALHDGFASIKFNGFSIEVKHSGCGQYRTLISNNMDIVLDISMANPLGSYAQTH